MPVGAVIAGTGSYIPPCVRRPRAMSAGKLSVTTSVRPSRSPPLPRSTTFPCPHCATGSSASASGNLAFTVKSDGFGFYWSGYGSSTDNVTGDGWVARAIQ